MGVLCGLGLLLGHGLFLAAGDNGTRNGDSGLCATLSLSVLIALILLILLPLRILVMAVSLLGEDLAARLSLLTHQGLINLLEREA